MNAPLILPKAAEGRWAPLFASLERKRLQCYGALIVGDVLTLAAAFAAAGYLYLGSDFIEQAFRLTSLILPALILIALYNGSYSLTALQDWRRGAFRALAALAQAAVVTILIAFYFKSSAEFSRFAFTAGVLIGCISLIGTRWVMQSFVSRRCGARVTNELLINDGGPDVRIPGALVVQADELGLRPAMDDPHALHRIGVALYNADRVLVSCPPERRRAWTIILKGANVEGEVLDEAVSDLSAHGASQEGGHGWLTVSIGPLGFRARILKRLFDITLAAGALVFGFPLLALIAIAILIEDGRPVLFVQRRVGRGNRFFRMFKFRSMRVAHHDADGRTSTDRWDARVTRVGRFIRRTSVDELPQLWNVLIGDMSLVGPRPHAIGSQAGDKLFWQVDERYWQRHALKPGLTGLAQIRGFRGPTKLEADLVARLDADLEYLDHWSLWRDIRILLATVRVLIHDRAF